MAISNDTGWVDFAENSTRIDVEKDLAVALQMLQEDAEQANDHIANLLTEMNAGDRLGLFEEVKRSVSDAIDEMTIFAEADSRYEYESDVVELTLLDISLVESDDEFFFTIVQIGREKLVAQIEISVTTNASCVFSLYFWDAIDGERLPMGDHNFETKEQFDLSILVTFEGDFEKYVPEVRISEVEVVEEIGNIYFGEIAPEYGDEDKFEEYD